MILQDPEKDPVNMTRITAMHFMILGRILCDVILEFSVGSCKGFLPRKKPVCGFFIVNV